MNLRKLLKMIYRVYINFKKGILDPEAEAIKRTIDSMGYKTIKNISKGNFFDIEISYHDFIVIFLNPHIKIKITILP